ncbi:putative exonuclease VIII, ds DNA exonuclease encoded by prophage [Escherichia coli 7-233-03_S3_C3]|nr:putative exonuclease VIII, ds DNA exonuclease encoded by prophage [Escherichia coli 7-233-03_S3_C3]
MERNYQKAEQNSPDALQNGPEVQQSEPVAQQEVEKAALLAVGLAAAIVLIVGCYG